jgi:hypothetical protein
MRGARSFRDWSRDSDRDSVTTLYVGKAPEAPEAVAKPAREAIGTPRPRLRGTPRFTPSVRSFEVAARELPALAPSTRIDTTHVVAQGTPAVVKIVFATACVILGIMIGGFVAFSGEGKSTAKAAAPAATAPAQSVSRPSVVSVAPAPAPKPARVTVRIESVPAGATAMLVDEGRTMLVGTTPIDTELDPSRAYELVLTLADHHPVIERIDPAAKNHVIATLAAKPVAESR